MSEPGDHDETEQFHPKGTILVLILFMLTLIVLWGSVYLILLFARGDRMTTDSKPLHAHRPV